MGTGGDGMEVLRGWKRNWMGMEITFAVMGGDGCNFCPHAGL